MPLTYWNIFGSAADKTAIRDSRRRFEPRNNTTTSMSTNERVQDIRIFRNVAITSPVGNDKVEFMFYSFLLFHFLFLFLFI